MADREQFSVGGELIVGANEHDLIKDVFGASFTIGTESSNAITVNVQLVDASGNDIAHKAVLPIYLSSDSAGDTPEATSATLSVAAGTDGSIIGELVTDAVFLAKSEADGDLDVVITETVGANTFYLNVVMPSGQVVTSGAITFA